MSKNNTVTFTFSFEPGDDNNPGRFYVNNSDKEVFWRNWPKAGRVVLVARNSTKAHLTIPKRMPDGTRDGPYVIENIAKGGVRTFEGPFASSQFREAIKALIFDVDG